MKRNKKPSSVKNGFEVLEDRRLMSAAALASGVLSLSGDNGQNNTFYVQPASGNRVLGYADNQGHTADIATLKRIVVHAGNQTDTVTVEQNVPMAVKVIEADGTVVYVQPGQSQVFGPSTSSERIDQTPPPMITPTPVVAPPPVVVSPPIEVPPVVTPVAPDARAPKAVITITDGATLLPGESVHVEGLDSSFGNGDALNSKIAWSFGDAGSNHNHLTGFNAAHAYDTPGVYTVTLTITNQNGFVGTTTQQVTVKQDNRQTIYVSANGNDGNSGLSADSPIQSIDRVSQLLTDNTRVLFRDGDTFATSQLINVNGLHDVYIGSYGQGSKPVLMYNGPKQYGAIITAQTGTEGLTIQGLTFDSIYTNELDDDAIPAAIHLSGSNLTVRDNTFLNVLEGVDMQAAPTNVLVQDNTAPSLTGLRAYFAWVQGSDISIVGNTVANSTREHIVRVAGASRVLIADNNLSNVDGSAWGDSKDTVKGSITIQYGTWAYVSHNTVLSGQITVGPLTITNPGPQSNHDAIFDNCVVEGNTVYDTMLFQPGAHDTVVRNNVVHMHGGIGFYVNASESLYGRQVQNLSLFNNTVTDTDIKGGFLKVVGGQAQNIAVDRNLFLAPNLVTGDDQAVIYVSDTSLSSFSEIRDNVWPIPQVYNWAQGGYFYVAPSAGQQSGYLTPQEWAGTGLPTGDIYSNSGLNGSNEQVTIDGITAGADLLASI